LWAKAVGEGSDLHAIGFELGIAGRREPLVPLHDQLDQRAVVLQRHDLHAAGFALQHGPMELERMVVGVEAGGGGDDHPPLAGGRAIDPGDCRGRVEDPIADARRLEEVDARPRHILANHLQLNHRRHDIGLQVVGQLDHLLDVQLILAEDDRMGLPGQILGVAGDCSPPQDHLHGRHQQAPLDELLLRLRPKCRERAGHGVHERLIRARGAEAGDDVR
jgi:hypothetical protein